MRLARTFALGALSVLIAAAPGRAATADSDELVEFSVGKREEKGPVVQLRTAPQVKLQPARKVATDPATTLHFFTPRAKPAASVAAQEKTLKALPMAGGVTPRYVEGAAAARFGAVTLGVTSSYSLIGTGTSGLFLNDLGAQAAAQRNSRLGILFGYGNVTAGAGVVQSHDLYGSTSGVEGNLNWYGEKWGANLTVGGYQGANANDRSRHLGVDLGASYRIGRALKLQGGVKLFDNPDAARMDSMDPNNPYATGVYLGTRLSF